MSPKYAMHGCLHALHMTHDVDTFSMCPHRISYCSLFGRAERLHIPSRCLRIFIERRHEQSHMSLHLRRQASVKIKSLTVV